MTDDQALHEQVFLPRTNALLGDSWVTFERAYANVPLCCPARVTLLTGQFSHNHGVKGNGECPTARTLDDTNTLPVWLRELYDMLGDPGQLRSRASESVFADTIAILSTRLRTLKVQ